MTGLQICSTCQQSFRTHTLLKNHIRRDHQVLVRVKFPNGNTIMIQKGTEGKFKCDCGREFNHPISIQRHGKLCNYSEIYGNKGSNNESGYISQVNTSQQKFDNIGTYLLRIH
jgi:Zinc finger, C2H2 type